MRGIGGQSEYSRLRQGRQNGDYLLFSRNQLNYAKLIYRGSQHDNSKPVMKTRCYLRQAWNSLAGQPTNWISRSAGFSPLWSRKKKKEEKEEEDGVYEKENGGQFVSVRVNEPIHRSGHSSFRGNAISTFRVLFCIRFYWLTKNSSSFSSLVISLSPSFLSFPTSRVSFANYVKN